MKLQRFNFREFGEAEGNHSAKAKTFLPSGSKREGATPPLPPPPIFNEEDIKIAEREGYKKGFLEGIKEGKKQAESEQADIERQLSETTLKFANYVTPLIANWRAISQRLAQATPKIALAIAQKVAGEALAHNADAMITDVAMRACEMMAGEPKLTITVHESAAPTLEKTLQQCAAKLQDAGEIVVLRDSGIARSDCRIEWKNGAIARDTATIWQQIEQIIDGMLVAAKRDTDAHLDETITSIAANNEQPT